MKSIKSKNERLKPRNGFLSPEIQLQKQTEDAPKNKSKTSIHGQRTRYNNIMQSYMEEKNLKNQKKNHLKELNNNIRASISLSLFSQLAMYFNKTKINQFSGIQPPSGTKSLFGLEMFIAPQTK